MRESTWHELTLIVRSNPAAAVLVDRQGIICALNEEFTAILHYTAEDLCGRDLSILLPQRIRSNHSSLVDSFIAQPVRRAMGKGTNLVALRKDGQEVPVEIGLNPYSTEKGVFVLATLLDVHVRKQMEEIALEAFQSAPYGNLIIDAAGTIRMVNAELCRIFGYKADSLLGLQIEMLLPERYRQGHIAHRALFARDPRSRIMGPGRDLTALHSDGKEFPVEIGISPINIGGESMAMASLIDITTRKKMELELRQLNSNLDEFTYVASHDLRSPLRGISDLTEWIREDLGDAISEPVANNLERIRLRIQRMERLIANLLAYARSSVISREISLVNIASMVDNIAQILAIPEGFSIRREIEIEPIAAAATPLETALRNLIANAIKHHDRAYGEIMIRAVPEGNFCHISVRDDGPGIPEHTLDRIFRLFQTASSQSTTSGIGLAITRRVVETHGGRVLAESKNGERGAVFHIWWPRFERRTADDRTYSESLAG